jgi:hypothetical protein
MTVFQKSTLTTFQRFVSRTTLLAGVTAAKLALISTGAHAVQLNQHTSFWLNRVAGSSGGGWVGDLAMKGVLLLSLVGRCHLRGLSSEQRSSSKPRAEGG